MASLTLSPVQLASAVGALHGLLLTGVLVAQRKNRTANRVLAALMGAFTIYLASTVYYGAGLVRQFPFFFGWSYPMPWLFGPLVYLYALAASNRDWRFTTRSWLHLVPAVVTVLVGLPFYLMGGADKLALVDRMAAGDVPLQLAIIDPTKFVSGIAYSVATAVYLRRHRRTVEQSYSNTARVNLRWLLAFAAAGAAIWLLATVLSFRDQQERLEDDHVALAMALLVYAVGYMGLRQPEVFRYDTQAFPVQTLGSAAPVPLVSAPPNPDLPAHEPPPPSPALVAAPPQGPTFTPGALALPDESAASRYARSGLGDDEAERLRRSLVEVMERAHPWKESELTLADLAARLGSTPHKLSEVLNAQLGTTFYDFVNGYRVREVQRRISAGEARTRKMLALAMDAGFASKSTFNQAFKKHTSQTPSEYREVAGA